MILVSSLSIFYWLVIGVAAYFILQGFGITTIELINVISTYSSSLLIGAISFIPGGIAVAEGSLVGLFSIQGINLAEAMVIVVIIRLFTLWFSTIAGFIINLAGKIPDRGEIYHYKNFEFKLIEKHKNQLIKISIRVKEEVE